MNNIRSHNGTVAAAPFETKEVQTTVKNGFAVVTQKTELTPLEVRADCPELSLMPGDIIYVRGDDCRAPYAREVHRIGDVTFILVPKDKVILTALKRSASTDYTPCPF